jgi:transcriptional regulator with XRE-family HTH domain
MGEASKEAIRGKMMGVLVRHARLRAGRSQAELADALHVSRGRYVDYESGKRELSLPELEVVADLCDMPLGYFFDDVQAVEDESLDTAHVALPRIRRKILGTLLRQARQCAGKSLKDCADWLGISPRYVSQYEGGDREIPASELEALASYLNVEPGHFTV